MASLFSPVQFGPLKLRNRAIRAAAFEGMSPHHGVSDALINYHQQVAAGGVGMTTVAYAAVAQSGLSFRHQLWLRPAILPDLQKLADAVHRENAAVSIQLGHCGNMAKRAVAGGRPISASARMNWYAPSFPRAMTAADIRTLIRDFGTAVHLARQAGFDAVEIHAGHGYLISQFLSPYTNHRTDTYGGSLSNRMRLMQQVMEAVLEAAAGKTAVLVKMNMRDGFSGGMELEESLQVAQTLQQCGVHGLVLSGGFVSKAPMYVLRGAMPLDTLANGMDHFLMRQLVRWFGRMMVPEVPFTPTYFLNDALLFRKQLKLPLVYVGGILNEEDMTKVLDHGFDAIAIARALIANPNFIRDVATKQLATLCDTCNHCIAAIYNGPFSCPKHPTYVR
ncbi:MAG: NADH:flavin oxidoreductase [Chitinophagales bacterium]